MIFRENFWRVTAAEFSSPKNCSHGHQLLHSTGTVGPKGLVGPGGSDLPSLLLCGGLWTPFPCHNTKQSKCSSRKLKRGLWSSRTQQPGHKWWPKNTIRRRRQKIGGVRVFWGQTEEDWLKIVFVPGAELAGKASGHEVHDKSSHRADCPHASSAEDMWKEWRRFLSGKTAMMVVGGRRADSSRQKEKKIIFTPTVQCQKIHREAQGWEGTGPLR